MMKRICLVGCGTIGRLHAGNLAAFADLYFCSRSRESAEAFQQRFKGRGVFEDFKAVLSRPEIDAVVIASPPAFHKAQVVQALEAGKAVLVEKPMCVSADEVAEIARGVERHPDVLLMVAENYYYKPSFRKIKALLDDGCIGEVKAAVVQKLSSQVPEGWKCQYGALLEGGVHFVALVSGFFGMAPVRVTAEFPGRREGAPERHSVTRLTYPNDLLVELRYSWQTKSLPGGVFQHSCIEGEAGRITFEGNGIYVWLNSRGKHRVYFPGMRDLMGYRAMTQDFLSCLENPSHQPFSDFSKARRDLQIVFDAYLNL